MKKIIAAIGAVCLVAFGAIAGLTAPASAHNGSVSGAAYCNDDGTWGVVWTFATTAVPSGVEGEVKAMTTSAGTLTKSPGGGVMAGSQVMLNAWREHAVNWPGVPTRTGNWSEKFSTVAIPASVDRVTTMVQYDFKGGPSGDPVGSVKKPRDCEAPDTSDQQITFCHATSSSTNPYNVVTTSVHAFYQAGHIDHGGDIYPAGSYIKGGQTYSWPAQGDLSLIANGCEAPFEPDTEREERQRTGDPDCTTGTVTVYTEERTRTEVAEGTWGEWSAWTVIDEQQREATTEECPPEDVVVEFPTPGVTDPCGSDNASWVLPEDTDQVRWMLTEDGRLIGTTLDGYVWPNGETVNSWGVAPERNADPCIDVIETPAAPATDDPCGVGNQAWVLPDDTDAITWSIDAESGDAVATIVTPFTTFPDESTTATFGLPEETNVEPCFTVIDVPSQPDVVDPCGPQNVAWVLPESTEVLTWQISEATGNAVVSIVTPALTFPDGSLSRDFVLPDDSGEPCPVGEKPEPLVEQTSSTSLDCDSRTQVTETVTTVTEFALDEDGAFWVADDPVSTTETTERPVAASECDAAPAPSASPSSRLLVLPMTGREERAAAATKTTAGYVAVGLLGLALIGAGVVLGRRRG